MYAAEIQRTDFRAAIDASGHLVVDNRRIDALFAMGNVGIKFFVEHYQERKDVVDAIPVLESLLPLALDLLTNNTVRPRCRRIMLAFVRDAISCMRDVGNEGKAYLARGTYWERLISAWLLNVEDTYPKNDWDGEGDYIISHLLVISDVIFTDATGIEDRFLAQVYSKATGEDIETKAKHIVRVALERIQRAASYFKTTGSYHTLTSCLNALFLLYQTDESGITILQHSLRDQFVLLDGIQVLEDILRAGLEQQNWIVVNKTLSVLFRHLGAVASSITIKRTFDIGLIKAVLEASNSFLELDTIAKVSIVSIVKEYIPESFVLRSVVKAFDVEELNNALIYVTDEGWTNIVNLHNYRRLRYHALVQRNGKERILCANVSAYIHCQVICFSTFNIPLHSAGL